MTRIALIGSAPSSVTLAPYHDPSWQIWACSPGAYPFVKRVDAWFETHRWEPPGHYAGGKPWFSPDYVGFLAGLKCPVYMIEPVPEVPSSVAYPKDQMLERFGPYFMTSSLSWMVCLAVASGAKEVALWGVDMAAREEWQFQRTGLQCLLWYIEKHYGVKITLPPESDLWVPPVIYGFCEANPMHIKLMKRRAELGHRMQQATQALEAARNELLFIQGANDDNEYHLNTWITDTKAREMAIGGYGKLQEKLDAVAESLRPVLNGSGEPIAHVPSVPSNGHDASVWPAAHSAM